MGGYLVNIDTADEYETIKGQIASEGLDNIKFWVGGARIRDNYDYHWFKKDGTFGEETLNASDYSTLWMVNEPSYRDGEVEEMYMNIFYYKKENRWVWNDVPNDILSVVPTYSGTVGYICEFD